MTVAAENHEQYDCLVVCFLSHGEHGLLYAHDRAFQPYLLWAPFAANLCPTLAGKPKLFFIQVGFPKFCVIFSIVTTLYTFLNFEVALKAKSRLRMIISESFGTRRNRALIKQYCRKRNSVSFFC